MAPSVRLLVWSIVAAQFGPPFLFSGVAVALPAMGAQLHMSAVQLGLVETTFLASSAAFLLPAGRLADAADRRSLYKWGLLAFLVLTFVTGLVSDAASILVLRFLQGAMAAVCGATGPAILVELVPVGQRGKVFGALLGVAYAGLSLGPFTAGAVVAHLGWRAVFFVGAGLILVGALPLLGRMRSRWHSPGAWVHWPSLVLLVVAVCTLVYATSSLQHASLAFASGGAGAALLLAFLWLQLRIARPLLDLRELVRNGPLCRALLVQMLLYLNAYCSIFMLSLFLQVTKALPSEQAGLLLAIGSLVMACVAPFAGRLADRMRPQVVAAFGVLAVVLSSALGTQLSAEVAVWHVVPVLIAQGVGFGLFSSPNLAAIMGSMHGARSGLASALASQSRSIGMFAGMTVTAALVSMHFGGHAVQEHPLRFAETMTSVYSVLLGTSLLAFVVALARWR
ncbi:MAG TPA: MFS transporter [Planctomycetota bacterium]|nr:MFS transporter [Planctomycetota bacterium]